MTDRELMQQALEAMGTVGADWICEASHHAKKDQHKFGEPCPLQQRWHTAYQALRERLALASPCCQDFDKCQQACMPRAAAAEREACAKVCYEVFDKTGLLAALQLSDKIRARGNT